MMDRKNANAQETISYYQVYEYAKSQDNNIKRIIQDASEEKNAIKNLEIVNSYMNVYCQKDNNPIKLIGNECYEWGKDYMTKGVGFFNDGFTQSGSNQSLSTLFIGETLFGLGGGIAGGLAGATHALYDISQHRVLNDDEKKAVHYLKDIAVERVKFFKTLNERHPAAPEVIDSKEEDDCLQRPCLERKRF